MKEVTVSLTIDGDQWSALIGGNIQEGVVAFGDTMCGALRRLADDIERAAQAIGESEVFERLGREAAYE